MKSLWTVGLCLALTPVLPAAEPAKEPAPAKGVAKVIVTAEVACMHCEFGQGESCATALKLDDKTPLLLEGKAAKDLFAIRFKEKIAVVEGTLKLKDKTMILVADTSRVLTDEEKAKFKKVSVRIEGESICGRCDLAVCDECTLAVKNGTQSIILNNNLGTELADSKALIAVTGQLNLDAKGLLRITATKVEKVEKK